MYHRMPSVPEKEEVDGEINWERRFDYMQQHSGQHILSAVLYRVMGYNTVSVHFGEEYASIETDAEHIKDSELVLLEEESNSLICRNIPIRGTWTTSDNLEGYSLRRETKVTGDVRIVALEDFDAVACGGVHCTSSGEVGLVKIIGIEKIRGRTRILFKMGRRAYEDYRLKTDITAHLCTLFSSRPEELSDRASAVLGENISLKQEIAALKREKLRDEVDRLIRETPAGKDGVKRIGKCLAGYEPREIVDMAKNLIHGSGVQVCLVLDGEDGLFWCIGCSQELDFPFPACRGDLLAAVDGKGGGRHPLWQGMGGNASGRNRFLEIWRKHVPETG